jgi:hypothetical protein
MNTSGHGLLYEDTATKQRTVKQIEWILLEKILEAITVWTKVYVIHVWTLIPTTALNLDTCLK